MVIKLRVLLCLTATFLGQAFEADKVVMGPLSDVTDGARSMATCPSGYILTHCQCSITRCNGAVIDSNSEICTVYNAGDGGSNRVQAQINCTRYNLSLITTAVSRVPATGYFGQHHSITCPTGWKIIACTYHSRWYRRGRPDFGLATIEGDDTCKIDCKKRGELACAVYAKCFTNHCFCFNGGTCLTDRCICPTGYVGSSCETFDFCAWQMARKGFPPCQNGGTCQTLPSTAIGTYDGDGTGGNCMLPFTFQRRTFTGCVDSNIVGPPFACGVSTNGDKDYVDLGSWSPGVVFTIEGWVKPKLHLRGRKTIFGSVDSCHGWGLFMNNDNFGYIYRPPSGCSVAKVSSTVGFVDQWHHVALTQDGNRMALYVNGTKRSSTSTKATFIGSAASFRVGGEECCRNNYWAGVVKNLNVWKKSMGSIEVLKLFKDPLAPFNVTDNVIRNHLIAAYEFGDNPSVECTGGVDHNNADWTPCNGDVIAGIHCNIDLFYIPPGTTVAVANWRRTENSNSGVNGTVTIFAQKILIKGALVADGKGYQGGTRVEGKKESGKQGESFTSAGSTSTRQLQGGGGGGLGGNGSFNYGRPGGGGGHGTAGKSGFDKGGNQAGVGNGGSANSNGDLRVLELGAGGGSGGNAHKLVKNPIGGKGGSGGGGIHLDARYTLEVTGIVSANGEAGQGDTAPSCDASNCSTKSTTNCWDWSGPGGGGAGGSIFLRGLVVSIGINHVTATGGRGGYGTLGCGGNGGMGRIRIDSHILDGNSNPEPTREIINNTFNDLATLARDALPRSTVTNAPEPSVYLGCFQDSSDRHFKYRASNDNALTPDKCKSVCYQKGYKYYALQNSYECFCDNNYGRYERRPERECNMACAGDVNRVCGGHWRMSIYGSVPRSPAVARVNAVQICEPYCQTAVRSGRNLFGLCIGQGKVVSWDIQCTCSAGFTGSRCQDPCPPGKYGLKCGLNCRCQNGGVCDPVNGMCNCSSGWTGETCTTACPPTNFGPGCTAICKCNRYCSPTDSLTCGYTNKTHQMGFLMEAELGTAGNKGASIRVPSSAASNGFYIETIGAHVYTASRAPLVASYRVNITIPGEYYPWLKVIANSGKTDSVYVSFDNTRKIAWHIPISPVYTWRVYDDFFTFTIGQHDLKIWKREIGVNIDQVFLGSSQAASTCDRINGSCTCQPGFTGKFCETPCLRGMYGLNCLQKCQCSANGVCNPRDGQCHCYAGWQGATCNRTCGSNTYGTGCQAECKCSAYGVCDHVTGACRCRPGYTGPTCYQLCPANRFGQDCSGLCQCRNGGYCDAITGVCQCPPGYEGSDCGLACPSGKYGQDCNQTCKCDANSGECNHITGQCKCKPGFRGATCNQTCGIGHCGQGCKFRCNCIRGHCDATDCSCSCFSGYFGVNCDTPCPQGRFGPGCTKLCSCKHAIYCNQIDGRCTCEIGWKGSSCNTRCAWGTFGNLCAARCKCVKANTRTCDPYDGTCVCDRGWSGLFCETACPSGTYGRNCLGNCSCQNRGVCNSANGACHCLRGYHGDKCQSLCSVGTFGYGCNQSCLCKNGATCNPIDGSCNCSAGWSGPLCDTPCPSDTWGLQCSNPCVNCSQGKCNPVTGACECFDGFTGPVCTQPCTAGWWGPGCHQQCKCVNGVCDVTDGACTCNPGYKRVDCSTACDVGTYGVGCVSVCQRRCKNSFQGCDPVDGHCMCTAGWTGPWCNSSCTDGTYGKGCTKNCSSCVHPSKSLRCHPVTGYCVCSPGYQGDNCDQPCREGWWGLNCTEQCACPVLRSTCDKVNGTCTCLPGYHGDHCDQTCPQGTWGEGCSKSCGSCSASNPHGVCNPVNGNCDCRAGWMGSDCNTHCPTGKWGVDCQENCLCEFGSCSATDGSCSCFSGFMGDYCDATCTNNTYGRHCSQTCSCLNGATCNSHTGICYCNPGYTGHNCDQVCPDGYFGHLCGRKCDCEHGATCNATTGACICPAGYVGARCEESCPDTNWGVACKFACSLCVHGTCNNIHGGCICDQGFQGNNCSIACNGRTFGVDCSSPCPDCPNNYPCSGFTGLCLCGGVEDYCVHGFCSSEGVCVCEPGYTGDDCSAPCSAGRYGESCTGICKCGEETCDFVSGACGCDVGTCGSHCNQTCDCPFDCYQSTCTCIEHSSTSRTDSLLGKGEIASIAIGCLLLVVLTIVFVMLYLRCKARTGSVLDSAKDTTGQVRFDAKADTVGFSNPNYETEDCKLGQYEKLD